MFSDEQLKIIYQMIKVMLDNKNEDRSIIHKKPKRRGTYNKQITSGVTDETYERISAYCYKKGICKAELIRKAVDAYLNLVCDPNLVGIDFDRILGSSASHV